MKSSQGGRLGSFGDHALPSEAASVLLRAVPDTSSERVSSSTSLARSQLRTCEELRENTGFPLNGSATFGTSAPMRGYCGMPAAMRALDVMNTPKVQSSGSTSEKLLWFARTPGEHRRGIQRTGGHV